MARYDDTVKMNPVTLCALVGGVVAFIAVGAIVDVLWVLVGIALGAGVGLGIRRLAQGAKTFSDAAELAESSTREELYVQAQRLGIEGRSTMTRDELAAAVAQRQAA